MPAIFPGLISTLSYSLISHLKYFYQSTTLCDEVSMFIWASLVGLLFRHFGTFVKLDEITSKDKFRHGVPYCLTYYSRTNVIFFSIVVATNRYKQVEVW